MTSILDRLRPICYGEGLKFRTYFSEAYLRLVVFSVFKGGLDKFFGSEMGLMGRGA